MSSKEAAFMAELVANIKKTDAWSDMLIGENLQKEYESMKNTMCKFVDVDAEDEIMGEVFGYVEEVTSAAILYGIRVADALRYGQRAPELAALVEGSGE